MPLGRAQLRGNEPMRNPLRWIMLPFALALAAPALAQEAQIEETSADGEETGTDDDIIVDGVRLREPEDLPVSVGRPTDFGPVTRRLSADAEMFSRCAGRPRLPLLHRIVDGRPETGETQKALHQHLVRNSGCLMHLPTPLPESPYFGICNPVFVDHSRNVPDARAPLRGNLAVYRSVCRADFDRGFIYEAALRQYAPDLRLSRSNTFDHATRERFRAREEIRNGARSGDAADIFYAAACMVQIRPEYALALLQEEPGSPAEGRLQAMMISDGSACVGSPAEVRVDPRHFRAFVAEAVYSWAVAVKRTDSLVPVEGAS